MRKHGIAVVAAILVTACGEAVPTTTADYAPVMNLVGAGNLVALHGVNMTNAIESPACPSASKGSAQIKIYDNGNVGSNVILYNKGNESIRFGHIHHLNAGAPTGPVIWWLTAPTGTDLNITALETRIAQLGVFVTNAHFASNTAGLAQLLAHPEEFYVNFHSDNCPGGFARAFLASAPTE